MQEHVNERTVALSIKAAKLTGRVLAQAMRAFLKRAKAPPSDKPGRHSIKSLTKDGASLSNVEIADTGLKAFDRVARKYNVKYHPMIDKSENPPKWVIFFKAKDADAITSAFGEYSKVTLREKNRKPSLLASLEKFKELAKQMASPVRNRSKGGHEL